MKEEPRIPLSCDSCGHVEEFEMTSLANGGFDTRDLVRMSESAGWLWSDDNEHTCPDCVTCDGCGEHPMDCACCSECGESPCECCERCDGAPGECICCTDCSEHPDDCTCCKGCGEPYPEDCECAN